MTHPSGDPPNDEFRNLVDAVIDGHASPEEKQRLEDRMREDPVLLEYCAGRLVFHSELAESVRPVRIELVQQRRIVIDGEGPDRQVLFGETRETRIGSRPSLIRIPDRERLPWYRRGGFIAGWLAVGLAAALGSWFVVRDRQAPVNAPAVLPQLILRNGGFELDPASDDPEGRSDTIRDWDDFFPCPDTGAYDLEKYSKGKFKARGGHNVARFRSNKPGWITQRLNLADGSPLLARKGMAVVVRGWAYLEDEPSQQKSIEISLRHVASTHPQMIQYVADSGYVSLKGGSWQPFSIRFDLSPFSLKTEVKHKEWGDHTNAALDLDGKALSLSIDNFYNPAVFLDDLTAELLDPGGAAAP
ncbi:MAG: hypothetical protein J0M04_16980 [Verrucomicrobia bacterium]|nr:hypothetical protein [Verrucomicrobiota bacterium]